VGWAVTVEAEVSELVSDLLAQCAPSTWVECHLLPGTFELTDK